MSLLMQMAGDPMLPHTSRKLASLGVPWELPATNEGHSGELITGEQEKKIKIPPRCPDLAGKVFPAPHAAPLPPISNFLQERLRKSSQQQMESPLLFPSCAWGTLLQPLILIRQFRRHPPSKRARARGAR